MKNDLTEGGQPRKVAIYLRVSTAFQIDKDSLPMQRRDLIAYSELILGISEHVVFEDAGYSGKNTDRPAFQEMMARIENHEFSHILVWKIDRISRNLLDFSEMYSKLKQLRVVFVSKNEQFDTSTAMGEAMLKIILVFAELERNMTAERVTATMISRASQGKWNGGHVPYGYAYDFDSGTFSVRDDEAEICRLMADDYKENHSLIHTARLLNEKGLKTRSGAAWSATAVWIILQSPFYVGDYRYNKYKGTERRVLNSPEEWVTVENHHPAIFTRESYEQVLKIKEENRRVRNTQDQHNRTNTIYVFGRICFCGKCGARMTSTTGRLQADGYRTHVYSCPNRRKTNLCNNPSINDLIIGEFVINYISNIINAKRAFSELDSPAALQAFLLRGNTFKHVKSIEATGLNELYNLFAMYKSDSSFTLAKKAKRDAVEIDPELTALKNDKKKQERALRRLQELYLYSEKPMSERDFVLRKGDITARIDEINRKLGLKRSERDNSLSDEEFIRKASHILINDRLKNREYIYYKTLAVTTSPDILKEYITSIVDNIQIADGRVAGIMFKNGIENRFDYKE